MKGYKVFNPDFTCNGYQFALGQTFVHEGEVELCVSGFHFCEEAVDCFNYYRFCPNNIVCEIEAEDVSEETKGDSKRVCGKITILKQLNWAEVLELVNIGKGNTGLGNSGNHNSGNHNSGNHNSGIYNSGRYNSGYRNSGNFNSGNRNAGNYNSTSDGRILGFCTENQNAILFNKPTNKKWSEIEIPYIHLVFQDEKGKYTYKEAWQNAWKELSDRRKQEFYDLPNFDASIFEEITGIDVTQEKG